VRKRHLLHASVVIAGRMARRADSAILSIVIAGLDPAIHVDFHPRQTFGEISIC
jgi:hypothetical protein